MIHRMSESVKAAMRNWERPDPWPPMWAMLRAADITAQAVPQVMPDDSNVLYCLPAGLSTRLTMEIAQAIADTAVDTDVQALITKYENQRDRYGQFDGYKILDHTEYHN